MAKKGKPEERGAFPDIEEKIAGVAGVVQRLRQLNVMCANQSAQLAEQRAANTGLEKQLATVEGERDAARSEAAAAQAEAARLAALPEIRKVQLKQARAARVAADREIAALEDGSAE